MKIRILTIGQKMPAWVYTAFEDYFKRIQPFVTTQLIELPMAKRGKNDSDADILKYCQIERETIVSNHKQGRSMAWTSSLPLAVQMDYLMLCVKPQHGIGHCPN